MNFRIVKKGSGKTRHLVICYYIGEYADAELIKLTPDNVCIINDTKTPTSRYTKISQNHKIGIASLESAVLWATNKLGFEVDKIIVGAFSAGGQAPRTLLINNEIPNSIFVADGTHCSLTPQTWQVQPWKEYCQLAKNKSASAIFSHTQIVPPTFSSTKKTLQLITGFPLDHKGTIENPALMVSGNCEVYSYEGKNASAHSKQATIVFAKLLEKTLENFGINTRKLTKENNNVTDDHSTWELPVKLDSKNKTVKMWQKLLISKGYDLGNAGADGHFGKKTEQATMAWQLDNGLAVDGVVGNETVGALDNPTKLKTLPWQDPTKSLGERALYFSLSEKAKNVREQPDGSNGGPEIKEYFKNVTRNIKGKETKLGLTSGNWCSVSACFAMEKSLLKDEKMPHGYRAGVVELIQDSMKLGSWKSAEDIRNKKYTMQKGDLAIFDRSVPGKSNTSWWRHVARVETETREDGKSFRTLGGNEKNCYQLTERDITSSKFIGCVAYPQDVYDVSNEPSADITAELEIAYPASAVDEGWNGITDLIKLLAKHFNESFK
jgi:hypothetical protein